jgi:hypothetical protein
MTGMTDTTDPDGRLDAVRGAAAAMSTPSDVDAEVLAAVQDGLLGVGAGSPTSWFDVPTQRSRLRPGHLTPRRRR